MCWEPESQWILILMILPPGSLIDTTLAGQELLLILQLLTVLILVLYLCRVECVVKMEFSVIKYGRLFYFAFRDSFKNMFYKIEMIRFRWLNMHFKVTLKKLFLKIKIISF